MNRIQINGIWYVPENSQDVVAIEPDREECYTIENSDFYFIHSYYVKTTNDQDIAATVNYGFDVVASVQRDNIFTTQFHPEKSQAAGLSLLKTFFDLNA